MVSRKHRSNSVFIAKPKRKSIKSIKSSIVKGGSDFGPASFNDPNFGGAYYGLNDYHNDLFGMTQSSNLHGGVGGVTSKKSVSKKSVSGTISKKTIKDFIITNYIKLKDKFKRKKNEILYNISKGDNGNDLLQIFKNGEKVFEFEISKMTISTAFCYFSENFRKTDNHSFDIDEKFDDETKNKLKNALHEFNTLTDRTHVKYVKDLPSIATSVNVEKDTHMHKSLGLFRKILFIHPVSIILTIIIWLSILITYVPLRIYCHNKMKNYTVKKSKTHTL
jgi:hypothetical protein